MRANANRGASQVAAPVPAEQRSGASNAKGFAGGSHRGAIYRHAPRPQAPSPRPGAPRPRRPPAASHAAGHHEEHAIHPDDLRAAHEEAARQVDVNGGRQQSGGRSARQAPPQPVSTTTVPPRVRMRPPPPPVAAGAALRRSLGPDAALLLTTPPPQGTQWPKLFDALASAFFATGGAKTAQRVDAARAARRHLPPDTSPVTLAQVKEDAVAWMAAQHKGANPSVPCTPQQQSDNLLFPIYMLGSARPQHASAASASNARAEMILHCLESLTRGSTR